MAKKTKILFVSYCDEWEGEGFFTEDGKVLQCWHSNDANWRGEYMDGLLEALGFEVVESNDPKLVEKVKKFTGG